MSDLNSEYTRLIAKTTPRARIRIHAKYQVSYMHQLQRKSSLTIAMLGCNPAIPALLRLLCLAYMRPRAHKCELLIRAQVTPHLLDY